MHPWQPAISNTFFYFQILLLKFSDAQNSPRLASPEEDDEAITINIVKSTPEPSLSHEQQPLLRKNKSSNEESPV